VDATTTSIVGCAARTASAGNATRTRSGTAFGPTSGLHIASDKLRLRVLCGYDKRLCADVLDLLLAFPVA
jgi:hypothetical protein